MARSPTNYKISAGSYTAASDARQGDRLLLSLVVERGMGTSGGRCTIVLGGPDYEPVAAGDDVTVQLDVGGGMLTVFTGKAYVTETSATSQTVRAADDLVRLARVQVEGAYESVTAADVISDILSKAGAAKGAVTVPALDLPAYVLHRDPRASRHLEVLAELTGADMFTSGDGKVNLATPKTGAADHRFKFGETVLAMDLRHAPPAFDGIEVWGESAASAQGSDKAHWLTTDLSGVTGTASVDKDGVVSEATGERPIRLESGALRTGGAAKDVASAWAKKRASRRFEGVLDVFGAPEVEPGDLIGITGLPDGHGAAKLLDGHTPRVRAVRHTLDRERGLRTRLEF